MAVVVVGGQARKVGKTSVVCGIINSTPELEWTAIKLTHHLREGQCEPVVLEAGSESGDCARFLASGAKHAMLIRTQPGCSSDLRPILETLVRGGGNFILESVGVIEFLIPDVFLLVVDPSNRDFKDSARRCVSRASALLAHPGELRWEGFALSVDCPVFRIEHGNYVTAEVVEFVRDQLARCEFSSRREP